MKKGTVQALSFLSGLTLAAVVIGITLSKSPGLRNEIESQIDSILKTTRSLVNTYKGVASKSKTAVNMIKKNPEGVAADVAAEAAQQAADANNEWDVLESSAPPTKYATARDETVLNEGDSLANNTA